MISTKDFKKGQSVCVILHWHRNPQLIDMTVSKVGTKYVYIGRTPYEVAEYADRWLVEHGEYGTTGNLLFLSRKDAEEFIEKQDLERWIKNEITRFTHHYSVEKLRKIKEVLENG